MILEVEQKGLYVKCSLCFPKLFLHRFFLLLLNFFHHTTFFHSFNCKKTPKKQTDQNKTRLIKTWPDEVN